MAEYIEQKPLVDKDYIIFLYFQRLWKFISGGSYKIRLYFFLLDAC